MDGFAAAQLDMDIVNNEQKLEQLTIQLTENAQAVVALLRQKKELEMTLKRQKESLMSIRP